MIFAKPGSFADHPRGARPRSRPLGQVAEPDREGAKARGGVRRSDGGRHNAPASNTDQIPPGCRMRSSPTVGDKRNPNISYPVSQFSYEMSYLDSETLH